ncbi:putative histone acetyltransferase complex component epl1 [Phaeomoniella chlamydospora]|uniref:Enhancer of polycomb-like protein n=1 Tax=Phaeomoniella chlamydospora TaxID=158046 RepID=A0A0G2E0A0_PHACM|nr:putative histone acetyltransferase complex component epl1 [Phaeomoniella chlamydospora]
MSARVASQRHTRPKKLVYKQNVPIFRENEIELVEYDPRQASTVETGVEAAEQNEYHLVAAINASLPGAGQSGVKDAYIPTPPTVDASIPYDALYPKKFQQPATYIRSSATVEDCSGAQYCMDEEDEIALAKINEKVKESGPCSEDQFEEVMDFFEETARNKQPFASVDNSPVLTLKEIEEQFDDTVNAGVKAWAKHIYEHWKERRSANGNHSVQVTLKFETSPEVDDADPYVCFRRREVRQIRKTRGRDAQSAEKLRKLRKELEDARMLVAMVKQRELARREQINLERHLFKQRCAVKDSKRKLGIKGDDDDLINQKPKKKIEITPAQQMTAPQLRFPVPRAGPNDDLRMLEDVQAEKEKAIAREIQQNVEKHIKWNEGFVDKTKAPLTPTSDKGFGSESNFRQAMPATEYLPTPPASVSEEAADLESPSHKNPPPSQEPPYPFRYATPPADDASQMMPSFRRRVGRGGRLMFDRRMPSRPKEHNEEDDNLFDRYKYDSDDDDEEDVIEIDPHDIQIMAHKAYLFARSAIAPDQARRQIEAVSGPANQQAASGDSAQQQTAQATS